MANSCACTVSSCVSPSCVSLASSCIAPRYRIGLLASCIHQNGCDSALAILLKCSRHRIDCLQPEFIVIGDTLDAICEQGFLPNYPHVQRFPYIREGGIMKLVSRIVYNDPKQALDAVIYLVDPNDPTSTFPEAVALKRQSVIHGKPFFSTLAGAQEWFELEAISIGSPPDPTLDERFKLGCEGIALIAHNVKKCKMVELVEKHFVLLDSFGRRYATGTTGGLLNELAVRIKGDCAANWVTRFRSGPMGGDAQIAELVREKCCRRVLFLEDPHVAHEHEPDIQLLERATRTLTDFALCTSDERWADRWLHLLRLRQCC